MQRKPEDEQEETADSKKPRQEEGASGDSTTEKSEAVTNGKHETKNGKEAVNGSGDSVVNGAVNGNGVHKSPEKTEDKPKVIIL